MARSFLLSRFGLSLVGLALVIAGVGCAGAQKPAVAQMPAGAAIDGATLVVKNAQLAGVKDASVVVVRGTTIAAVGGPELLDAVGSTVPQVDAGGGWLFPGFHDAHLHMLGGGLGLSRVYLVGARTYAEASDRIVAWAKANPDRPWVLGRGWAYELFEKKAGDPQWKGLPTKEMLDKLVPDRPAVVRAYDGHTAWANTLALKAAGITKDTKDPADGTIVRREGGEPSGALLEGAYDLLLNVIPKPTRAEMKAGLAAAVDHLTALGVTGGDAIEAEPEEFELLQELEVEGRLPMDLNVILPIEGDFDAYEKLRARNSAHVRFVGVKAFVDGVVESKTAFMLAPYTGTKDEIGRPLIPKDTFFDLVNKANARGFQVSIHAIGDAGVRMSLDAIAAARVAHPEIKVRHRLEHIEVLDPVDAPRFAQLGVVASMQPYHAIPIPPDANVGAWPDNAGAARVKFSWAWRTLLDAGAPLTYGSDWPVYTSSPMSGMAMATTRQNEQGFPPGGWNAHQRVTFAEALRAYTVERGAPGGPATDVGLLAPGQRADFVVFPTTVAEKDPLTWFDKEAQTVVVEGRVVRPAAAP